MQKPSQTQVARLPAPHVVSHISAPALTPTPCVVSPRSHVASPQTASSMSNTTSLPCETPNAFRESMTAPPFPSHSPRVVHTLAFDHGRGDPLDVEVSVTEECPGTQAGNASNNWTHIPLPVIRTDTDITTTALLTTQQPTMRTVADLAESITSPPVSYQGAGDPDMAASRRRAGHDISQGTVPAPTTDRPGSPVCLLTTWPLTESSASPSPKSVGSVGDARPLVPLRALHTTSGDQPRRPRRRAPTIAWPSAEALELLTHVASPVTSGSVRRRFLVASPSGTLASPVDESTRAWPARRRFGYSTNSFLTDNDMGPSFKLTQFDPQASMWGEEPAATSDPSQSAESAASAAAFAERYMARFASAKTATAQHVGPQDMTTTVEPGLCQASTADAELAGQWSLHLPCFNRPPSVGSLADDKVARVEGAAGIEAPSQASAGADTTTGGVTSPFVSAPVLRDAPIDTDHYSSGPNCYRNTLCHPPARHGSPGAPSQVPISTHGIERAPDTCAAMPSEEGLGEVNEAAALYGAKVAKAVPSPHSTCLDTHPAPNGTEGSPISDISLADSVSTSMADRLARAPPPTPPLPSLCFKVGSRTAGTTRQAPKRHGHVPSPRRGRVTRVGPSADTPLFSSEPRPSSPLDASSERRQNHAATRAITVASLSDVRASHEESVDGSRAPLSFPTDPLDDTVASLSAFTTLPKAAEAPLSAVSSGTFLIAAHTPAVAKPCPADRRITAPSSVASRAGGLLTLYLSPPADDSDALTPPHIVHQGPQLRRNVGDATRQLTRAHCDSFTLRSEGNLAQSDSVWD